MGGYQLIITDEVFRARFSSSFERPESITPNRVIEYLIHLRASAHSFLKGHRIMVQVQSVWFPVIDRNLQKFVTSIWKATEADYQKPTEHVYRSKRYPSSVEIQVRQQ